MDAQPVVTQVNPTTDRVEPTYEIAIHTDPAHPDIVAGRAALGDEMIDAHGNAVYLRDPDTGRPVMRENPAASAVSRRSYENQRVYGPQNPGDPINSGTIGG